MKRKRDVKRGEIYIADLNPVIGSEQGGVRPVIVLQNNIGNACSDTVVCATITSRTTKAELPTHVSLNQDFVYGTVLLEQIRTISKERLTKKLGTVTDLTSIEKALCICLSLPYYGGELPAWQYRN